MATRRRRFQGLSEDALRLMAARFRALSDPTRPRPANLPMAGESAVQDLVDASDLEQPTVSRHLGVLRREGLVERRSDGNRAIYRIVDPSVVELCEIVCGGLAGQLSDDLDSLPDPRMWKGMGI